MTVLLTVLLKVFLKLFLLSKVFALTQSNNNAALLDSDPTAEMSLTYLNAVPVLEVDGEGQTSAPANFESLENLQLKAARHLNSAWQMGLSIQGARRRSQGLESLAVSDLNADVGYQLLPSVLIFTQLIYPASRSNYETDRDVYQLDALGRGFWGVAVGFLWNPEFGPWQVQAFADGHRSFPRDFANAENAGTLVPGWGGDLGAGLSRKVVSSLTVSAGFEWVYEDPVQTEALVSQTNPAQRFLSLSVGVSYHPTEEWDYKLGYLDQTVGLNDSAATLLRGMTLGVQRSWP